MLQAAGQQAFGAVDARSGARAASGGRAVRVSGPLAGADWPDGPAAWAGQAGQGARPGAQPCCVLTYLLCTGWLGAEHRTEDELASLGMEEM